MNSGSSPRKIWYASKSPRSTPLRTGRSPRASLITFTAMNGITNHATKFGWAFAWETIEGANPHTPPPMAAATLDCTRCRENTQYQAAAVPATPTVSAIAQVTVGPNVRVTGVNGIPKPSIAVLDIMFTPSG